MPSTFIAVVAFGLDPTDRGILVENPDGTLTALWTDGAADSVYRDNRGWYWSEYGETEYPRGHHIGTGTRLPIVSRAMRDATAIGYPFTDSGATP